MSQYFNNQFRRKIWANKDAIAAQDMKRVDSQVAKIREYVDNTKFEAEDMSGFITKEQLKEKSDKNHVHAELAGFNHKHDYEELDDRPVIIDPANYVSLTMIENYYDNDTQYDRLGINTQIINCSNIIEYKFYTKKDIDIKVIKLFNDRYDKLPKVQLKLFARIDDTYGRKNVTDKVDAITYDMAEYYNKHEIYNRAMFTDKMNKKAIDAKKFISKDNLADLAKAAEVYTAVEFTEKEATKAPEVHTHEELVPIGELEKTKDRITHNHAASGVDFPDGRTLQQKFDDGSLSDGAPAQTRAVNIFMDIFKNTASLRDGDLVQTFGFHKLGAGEGTYLIKKIEPTDTFFDSFNGVEINEICDIKISTNFKARLMSSDGKISLWQLGVKDYNPNIESTRLVQSAINKCGLQKYNLDLTGCKFNARKIIINQGITIDGGGACYIINKWEEPTILVERVPEGRTFTLSNMVIGGTVVDAKASNFKAGRAIGILVNMIEELYRVRIEGVNVKDFSYAGMVIKGWDTDTHNNCVIHTMRCYFVNSYIGGLCLGNVGANAFEQSFFNMCRYGFINSGSVLAMDGCQFTHNVVVGFWNTNEFGTNTKVSRVLNCTSNHNDNCGFYSESEAGLLVQGMQIWYGHVILKGNGAFSNFQYGGGTGTGPDGFQFFIDTDKKWTISGAIGMVGGAKIYVKNPNSLIAEANTRLPVMEYTESMVTKVLAPPVMLEYEQTKTPTFSPSKLNYSYAGAYQDDYAYTSFCKIGGDGNIVSSVDGSMIMGLGEKILLNRDITVNTDVDKLEFEFESKLINDRDRFRGHFFHTDKNNSKGLFGLTTFNSEIDKLIGTFVILNSGVVYGWGGNNYSRLGVGSSSPWVSSMMKCPFPEGVRIKDIVQCTEFTKFIDTDNRVWCAGRNYLKALAPTVTDVYVPVLIDYITIGEERKKVIDVICARQGYYFQTEDGKFYMKGEFSKGLGFNSADTIVTFENYTEFPQNILPNSDEIDKIYTVSLGVYIVAKSGNIYHLGEKMNIGGSNWGSIGNGTSADSLSVVPTLCVFRDGHRPSPNSRPVSIVGSEMNTVFFYDDGEIYVVGYNADNGNYVQSGINITDGLITKSLYTKEKYKSLCFAHCAASGMISEDGVYYAIGYSRGGILGNGVPDVGLPSLTPIYFDMLDDDEVLEQVSYDTTYRDYRYMLTGFILTSKGRIIHFGDNRDGCAGIGNTAEQWIYEPTINENIPKPYLSYILCDELVDDPLKDTNILLGARASWKFNYTKANRRFEVRRNNTLVFSKVLPVRIEGVKKTIKYMFDELFYGDVYRAAVDIDSLL